MANTWQFRPHIGISFTLTPYSQGGTSVQAWEIDDEDDFGSPYARISVFIDKTPTLPEGQFFLKDWSENQAIAQAMIAEGIIESVQPYVSVQKYGSRGSFFVTA